MRVHYHRYVGMKGVNSYWECRCGSRRVRRGNGLYSPGLYSPIDRGWLEGQAWDRPHPPPPRSHQPR